jgi:hypothetical protein
MSLALTLIIEGHLFTFSSGLKMQASTFFLSLYLMKSHSHLSCCVPVGICPQSGFCWSLKYSCVALFEQVYLDGFSSYLTQGRPLGAGHVLLTCSAVDLWRMYLCCTSILSHHFIF